MKRIISAFFALIIAVSVLCVPVSGASAYIKVYGIYTENGDCTLLNMDGNWLLIDMGMAKDADSIIKTLKGYGVKKLDFYVSHLHSDHYGDYKKLAESFTVEKLYLPNPKIVATDNFKAQKTIDKMITNTVEGDESRVIYLSRGSTFGYDSTTATVLGPVGNHSFDGTAEDVNGSEDIADELSCYINNCSLTTRFDCGGFSYLTCGDIEVDEESALVSYYKKGELKANLLKMPHHGLSASSSEKFIAAVSPDYAYALNGAYTGLVERSDGTGMISRCYKSRKRVSEYGMPYMVGNEGKTLTVVYDGSITLYRGEENAKNRLNGFVSVVGADGVNAKYDKYYIKNGITLKGVQKLDGKLYCFSNGGCALRGVYSGGKYSPLRNAPHGLCAFREDCSMYTGLKKIGNYTSYYSPQTGARVKSTTGGWSIIKVNGYSYAVNKNGVIYDKNCNYSGWLKFGSKYRYFEKNGKMKTGWATLGGNKYYFNLSNGYRATGLLTVNKKTYYFDEYGKLFKGGWKHFGNKRRYFSKTTGEMKTGWFTSGKSKYYMNKSTGYMTTGFKTIGKNKYYFKSNGKLYKSGWKSFGGKYRYFDKKTGKMKTGWLKIGKSKYYLNKSTGYRVTDNKKIGGKKYKFAKNGKLL